MSALPQYVAGTYWCQRRGIRRCFHDWYIKENICICGQQERAFEKIVVFSLLNGIFASFQFGALYFVVDALASDNHSFTSVWLSLGMMALSITGRIFASFFSMNEQTVVGYGMVADKRISIGDRLRYIPMGYFNKNNIGSITGIVTTTLGDVEGAAPVALVNMIGGFFNSVVLIVFLLFLIGSLGLAVYCRCAGLFTGDGSSIQKICFCRRKKAERPTGIGRGCFGVHSRDGLGKILWI